MSQSVARLKELLFDDETQALAEIRRRLDATASANELGRAELRALIDDIVSRAVTSERLTDSVAAILSDALRKAEIIQHVELSSSIAPLVVTTIKTELRNSQDEMVEALYPITGRLVKAYVASAIKDLADQINRRIEQAPLMLQLRSLSTGRSVADLAMADTQDFQIDDVILIRRGAGELLARWPERSATGREHAISGVLAAINEFANDALAAEEGQLRQIDLGGVDIYLRGSPKYLLAARCSGTAPQSIERLIDDAFLVAIERQHDLDQAGEGDSDDAKQSALAEIGRDLAERLSKEKARLKRPAGGGGALKFLAFLILTPVLGWVVSSWYGGYATANIRDAASRTTQSLPAMKGYPISFDVGPFGHRLTVSGLAPNEEARFQVAHVLRRQLPRVAIQDRLTVVPGAGVRSAPDMTADIVSLRAEQQRQASAIENRDVDQSLERLTAAFGDIKRATASAKSASRRSLFIVVESEMGAIGADLAIARANLASANSAADLDAARASLADVSARIPTLIARLEAGMEPTRGETQRSMPLDVDGAEPLGPVAALAIRAERAAAIASVAKIMSALERQPDPPATPRQILESEVRAKAVFFDSGTAYRDEAATVTTLATLARLITDANLLVRVIGYTDEAGGSAINSPLAQQRADRVRNDLLAAGAPPQLVAAIGRSDRLDISAQTGAGSPNRRAEFEVGFDGEAPQ